MGKIIVFPHLKYSVLLQRQTFKINNYGTISNDSRGMKKKQWIIKPGRSGWGRVKRREYLMFLVAIREEEHQAQMLGLTIKPKSIEEVRQEFEKEHGSIYMDF
jgi:hypothetical protein